MNPRSLRSRLLVWNSAVIVLILVGFAAATVAVTRGRMTDIIDRELHRRADEAMRLGPPPPDARPRGPFGGFGSFGQGEVRQGPPAGQRGPKPPDSPELGPDGPPQDAPGGGMTGPVPRVYQEASRLADIRRPRFVGQAKAEGPGWSDPPFDEKLTDVDGPVIKDLPHIRVLAQPVVRDGRRIGTIQVANETEVLEAVSQALLVTIALLLPCSVVFVVVGARILIDRALRPVDQVTATASAISAEDMSKRLPVIGDDELSRMSKTFNGLLDRLEGAFAEQKQAYSQLETAFEAQQRFTADASHELRTPLTRVRLSLGNALNAPDDILGLREAAAKSDATVAEMSALVEDLLTLARTDAGVLKLGSETVDLRVAVADGMEAASVGRGPKATGMFPDSPVTVQGDEALLRRVIINLVSNARRHTPDEGAVFVSVGVEGTWAVVKVSDTGDGISAADLPHIFDRFYRSDDARGRRDGGTGLGLAITKGLIEAHKGRVDVASHLGEGTVFRVLLPLA